MSIYVTVPSVEYVSKSTPPIISALSGSVFAYLPKLLSERYREKSASYISPAAFMFVSIEGCPRLLVTFGPRPRIPSSR